MIIKFANNKDEPILIQETVRFEHLFEPALRLELGEKKTILEYGLGVWMFVDGNLAGETYAATPYDIFLNTGDDIPDTFTDDNISLYCYSTSILKPFQGMHLAPVLMAYFQGFLRARGWSRLIGHTTTFHMRVLRERFGAVFIGNPHKNWCGSKREASFYEQSL